MNSSLSNIVTPFAELVPYICAYPSLAAVTQCISYLGIRLCCSKPVEAVKAYYNRFTAELPTIADLAACQRKNC